MKSEQRNNPADDSIKTWVYLFPGTEENIVSRVQSREKLEQKINDRDKLQQIYLNTNKKNEQDSINKSTSEEEKISIQRFYQEEKEKYEKEYKNDLAELISGKANSLGDIYEVYKPSNDIKHKSDSPIRFEILQGVGTTEMNPWGMETTSQNKSQFTKFLKAKIGLLTGKGEKENINVCMKQLEDAERTGKLPNRLILNGHSRGASACIELARAIYIKYGDKIKIAMNINDPVPGPGRHTKSKMVIPPNVDSLVVSYAAYEKNLILKPQDFNQLYFDPTRTTVTTMALPTDHIFNNDDGTYVSVLKNVNEKLIGVFQKGPVVTNNDFYLADDTPINGLNKTTWGQRKNCKFIVATDPALNKELPPKLSSFHTTLQGHIHSDEEKYREKNRIRVHDETEHLPEKTVYERKRKLAGMYQVGKHQSSLTKKVDIDDNDIKQWQAKILGNNIQYEEILKKEKQNLKNYLDKLKFEPQKNREKIDIIQHCLVKFDSLPVNLRENESESKKLSKEEFDLKCKKVFKILSETRNDVLEWQKNNNSKVKSMFTKGLTFLHAPIKTTGDRLITSIDNLMSLNTDYKFQPTPQRSRRP